MFLKDYYPKLNKKFNKAKFNGIAFESNAIPLNLKLINFLFKLE